VTIKVWGLAVGLVVTGCSFGMNVAPSDPSKRTTKAARDCTDSVLFPIGDTLAAGVGAYNVGVSVAAHDKVTIYGAPVDKSVGLALGISQLVAFGAAATYGYIQVARCNSLKHEQHVVDDADAQTESKPTAPPPPPVEAAPGTSDDHDATEALPAPAGSNAPPEQQLPSWSAFRRMPMPGASTSHNRYEGTGP
jgi:hypothetical protein